MNKQEFLIELENALCGMPSEDIQKSLDFYSEMIDDRIEDGVTEENAVFQIGDIEEIVKQILMDTPITRLVKQKMKPKRRMNALEIVLLILGAPIWLSLLIAVIAVVLSVYVTLWSIIISFYAVMVSLLVCGATGVIACGVSMVFGKHIEGAFWLGAGILCIGLGILMLFGCDLALKGIIWLSRKIWLFIKSCFVKGDVK